MSADDDLSDLSSESQPYVVVARRYRPQGFTELVGQDQVVDGLKRAITTDRVGHAYLFTGARGVGKTSMARIFAKALNCTLGPTDTPCGKCDICEAVSIGEDIDVIEIDGASNRQIDDIREIRSNISIRPSRARYKIYIIDEVHMLTREAFNALLKTLEEPPGHVKFLFCTTDPEKIPITVLSRCQRFDFAPIASSEIIERLEFIVKSENATVDSEALRLLARRAGGSMRDSQSLLEQLLAFGGERITVEAVHNLLGTASSGRLTTLVENMADADAAAALAELDGAVADGVDAGQLAEQMLGLFRDLMAASVDCSADIMLHSEPEQYEGLCVSSQQWGLEKLLAAIQILDHAVMRMRQSLHARTLLETALVRICRIESLDEIGEVLAQLQGGSATTVPSRPAPTRPAPPASPPRAAPSAKKKRTVESTLQEEVTSVATLAVETPTLTLTADTVDAVWKAALGRISDMTVDYAKHCDSVVFNAPDRLIASFSKPFHKKQMELPESLAQLREALFSVTGVEVRLEYRLIEGTTTPNQPVPKQISKQQLLREAAKEPIVQQAMELFDAVVTDVVVPPTNQSRR